MCNKISLADEIERFETQNNNSIRCFNCIHAVKYIGHYTLHQLRTCYYTDQLHRQYFTRCRKKIHNEDTHCANEGL